MAEHEAVNFGVPGSSPGGGVRNLRRSSQGARNGINPLGIFTTEIVSYSIANCQDVGFKCPTASIRISVMYAYLAQLVEQGFCKAQVVGSSPSVGLTI